MNWDQALLAMRDGATVRQVSEAVRKQIGTVKGKPTYHAGTEPARMAKAYCEFGLLRRVLVGAWSGCPFVPTKAMLGADDWIAVKEPA